jgi:hypothetical protein
LKPAEIAPPDLSLIGYDAADVVGIFAHKIGVQVTELAPHLVGVLLIHAEDEGLGGAVGAAEEVGQMAGDRPGAARMGKIPLEIGRLVDPVGDLLATQVALARSRPIARGIDLGDHAMHTVRGQEAVIDALAQTVGVDRVPEIAIRVTVVRAERGLRHPELIRRLEVLEDLAPAALIASTAAMALVDNDEVEEVGCVFSEEAGAVFVPSDRLIGREVHFAALDGAALDLVARFSERNEGLVFREAILEAFKDPKEWLTHPLAGRCGLRSGEARALEEGPDAALEIQQDLLVAAFSIDDGEDLGRFDGIHGGGLLPLHRGIEAGLALAEARETRPQDQHPRG